jgi:putative tryptophan/tyrosine transport system substrate-binding protein
MRRRDVIIGIGGAIALPLAALAEQKPLPVIGWLSPMSAVAQGGNRMGESGRFPAGSAVGAFHEGLNEIGYVEGQNVAIEYRWADGHFDRLPALAADLVARNVDVIVTVAGNRPALAAKTATSTIPIVFTSVVNPVDAGLVVSLARPGDNLTGFTGDPNPLEPKRLELLSELVPDARIFGLLVANPIGPAAQRTIGNVEEAAHAKGVKLLILKVSNQSDIDAAFASLVELHVGALVVASDPFFTERGNKLVTLAARYAIPVVYHLRGFVTAGGLISYGTPTLDWYRGSGTYVGRILAGAKPADLPVQQPTKFELVINMKTANMLGLTVPPLLLATADEVIE